MFDTNGERILRAVVALVVARLRAGTADWVTTADLLGHPFNRARGWTHHAFSRVHGANMKGELILAAHTLIPLLADQPVGAAWADRPILAGNGLTNFRSAQTPHCPRDDPSAAWCPCGD